MGASAFVDFILNGQGHGELAQEIAHVRFDTGLLRPFLDEKDRPCVTVNTGRTRLDEKTRTRVPVYETVRISDLPPGVVSPVVNATTLRKDDWIQMNRAVNRVARQRMTAWTDLVGRSSLGGFNGMSKMTLEYEAISDAGEAVVDMDVLAEGRTDAPKFILRSIPLPITHSDFWFSERRLAVSRASATPLDTTMVEMATRRVAETVEQTLIGTITGVTYGTNTNEHTGTSKVYGYTNFPYRTTKTDLHSPSASSPEQVVEDVIEMRELLYANNFFGPFMVYHSTGYDRFLDDDYFRTGGTSAVRTLRERLSEIDGILGFKRLDYLTSGYQLIMVQMTPDVVQAINAMPIQLVQWETQGGMRKMFKVMCIQVPLFRADYNGETGIVHGTTS